MNRPLDTRFSNLVSKPVDPPGNFSYTCGDYTVFRVIPADSDSYKFLPKLHVRALEFVDKYGAGTDPVWLAQLLYKTQPELIQILIAIDKNDRIVAHSITFVDQYQSLGAVAMLMQLEIDKSVDESARKQIHNLGLSLVKEWAKALKLKTILAYVLKPSIARLLEVDNFYDYRIVKRHDLEE